MSRFSLRSKEASDDTAGQSVKERISRNWHLIFVLSAIIVIAFILRAFFAYDLAVSGGYALSGGSDAAYHVRVIENIVTSWSHVISDPAMNYPYGDVNVNPPLMDWVYAIIAAIVTLFGVSAETAATGVLIWSTPILGALTCIPVYMLAKEMFDHKVGVISTLLYAICAVAISQTVLSNATEAAFYGFFFVWMIYFLYKAVKTSSRDVPERKKGGMKDYIKSVFELNRNALKYALFASIMLIIVELSWNGFRPIVLMLAAIMIVQVVLDRIKKKDPTSTMVIYGAVLLISTIVCAPIYAAVSLWSLVYSGPFFIAIFTILFALILSETKGKPWVLVLPILIIALAIILVIMYFAVPGLYGDIVGGNSIYTDPTFSTLVGMNSTSSLSALAAYYGWFTIWLPYVVIALMIFKFSDNTSTPSRSFILMWLVAMMAISLMGSANVFLAASAYMIGAAVMIMKIIDKGNLPAYVSSFKGVGRSFKSVIKKIFQPTALASIFTVTLLVAAPNAMYAIDAATPSNSESSGSVSDYTGAFGYYVKNNNDWKMNGVWDHYADEDKSGSMVSWWDYSSEAVYKGGFNAVAGANGAGAAAASNILLAQGGAEANLTMAIRVIESEGLSKFKDFLIDDMGLSEEDYDTLNEMMSDPSKCVSEVLKSPEKYGKYSSDLTDENAMYAAVTYFLLNDIRADGKGGLSEAETVTIYDKVCSESDKDITYIVVSSGMFPIAYGDGSVFNTLAYMSNYYLDANGSPTTFYSYASSGYYTYTDAMYQTLIWKAYMGAAPADMGYSSATAMMNAFALSDGGENTRPQPGFGLSNYQVSYWRVMYNPSSEAELDSDGWVEMDAFEAMDKQDSEGGMINFMSGIPVVLEYVHSDGANKLTGTVTIGGTEPVANARVSFTDEYGIQKATVFTDENGKYEMYVPFTKGTVEVFMGSSNKMGGLSVGTLEIDGTVPATFDVSVDVMSFLGWIYYADVENPEFVVGELTVEIQGTVHGMKKSITTMDGTFSFDDMVPDKYTITVKDENGNSICTGTYEPVFGTDGDTNTVNVEMFLTTATITVKLTDEFGKAITSEDGVGDTADKAYVLLTSVGDEPFSVVVDVANGEGTAKVVPGTYIATLVDENEIPHPKYELFNATVTVASGGSSTLTAKAEPYQSIEVTSGDTNPMTLYVTNGGMQISVPWADTSVNKKISIPVGADTVTYYVYGMYTDASGKMMMAIAEPITASFTTLSNATVALNTAVEAYEFSKTLKSTEDKANTGYLNFYPVNNGSADTVPFISAWSPNGKVTVWLPAGKYVLHAYSGTSSVKEAYLDQIEVTGSSRGGDIPLVKAKTMSLDVYSSDSGSGRIAYANIWIKDTTNGMMINAVSSNSGAFSYFFPGEAKYTFSVNKKIGDDSYHKFVMVGTEDANGRVNKDAATSTNYITAIFRTSTPTTFDHKIKFVDQNEDPLKDVEVKLKLSATASSEVTFRTNDEGILDTGKYALSVGTYSVDIEKDSGYYYDSNMTVYISSGDVTIETTKLAMVKFTGLAKDDKITVEALNILDEGTGVHYSDEKKQVDDTDEYTQTYYFEYGKEFQIKVMNADADKVWNYHYDATNAVLKTEAVTLAEFTEISGFAGYPAVGIVTIMKDGNVVMKVKSSSSGRYTAQLLELGDGESYVFSAMLGEVYEDADDGDKKKYTYNTPSDKTITEFPESKTVNMIATGKPYDIAPDEALEVTIDNIASSEEGKVTFDVTVNGNTFKSLFLTGGAGWSSIVFMDSVEIDHINGGADVKFTVEATFDKEIAGDDPSLTIIFKDAAGKTVYTKAADITSILTPAGDISVDRGEDDNYGDNEYRFAIDVNNEKNVSSTFTIASTETLDGWYLAFTDADGTTVTQNSLDGTAAGGSVTTVYVKLVNNGATSLPDKFDVTVAIDGGTPKTIEIEPKTTALDLDDGGASGPNVFGSEGSIPMYVWAMVAGSILLFVLILWLGMKRGVFTRKK